MAVGNLEWVQSHSQTHSTAQHPTPLPSQHSDGQATSISGGGLDNTSYDQHQQRREENLQSNRISSSSDRSSSSSSSSSDISSSSSSRSSDGADSGNSNVSTEMQDRLNSNAGASSRQAGSSNSGLMRVYVALNGKLAGCFEISDQLRSDAAATIRGLQQQGLDAILLSGMSQLYYSLHVASRQM